APRRFRMIRGRMMTGMAAMGLGMVTDNGIVIRIEDYRPSDYMIPTTRMTFRLDHERTRVVTDITVERRDGVAANAPLTLDGDGLTLVSLAIDGRPAADDEIEVTPDRLVIHQPPASTHFTLRIETETAPARNQALMGLYRSNGVYCTQCEAE